MKSERPETRDQTRPEEAALKMIFHLLSAISYPRLVWFLESGLWFFSNLRRFSDRRSLKSVIGKLGYPG